MNGSQNAFAGMFIVLTTACLSAVQAAAPAVAPASAAAASAPGAAEALDMLKSGNARFAHQHARHPHLDEARRHETAAEQHPLATVLACSDSRVPVEEIFDEGIGDVFVIRVAGNVCDTDETGSIEYGVVHLNTPLVVVLGHTSCGAVTAVATGEIVHGSIPALVDNIVPAVAAARRAHPDLVGKQLVPAAIRANVFQSMADLLSHSEDIRDLVKQRKVIVLGAVYHVDSGEVEWLGPHPRQRALLAQPPARPRTPPAQGGPVSSSPSSRPSVQP